MSRNLKLLSALPADEVFNGLDFAMADAEKEQRVAVLCIFEVMEVRDTVRNGIVRVIAMTRNEPLGRPDALPIEVQQLVMDAQEARTGGDPLPLDVVVAPKAHPDVCDHRWADEETDDTEDVPAGMVRKGCLKCGYTKYFQAPAVEPGPDDVPLPLDEAPDDEPEPDGLDEFAAVVPHDSDVTILDPFRKARR
jgi:hypothetical protein